MDLGLLQLISRIAALSYGAIGGVLLVWALLRARRRGPRRLCPGPAPARWRRLLPTRLFFRRPCGYDLLGLPVHGDGTVTCPECGGRRRPAAALRSAARLRVGRLAAAFLLMAVVARSAPMLKTHRWQRHVPSVVLIGVKRALGTDLMPTRLRRELDSRLADKQLRSWEQWLVRPALQRDLRSDRSRWNGGNAAWYLQMMGDRGWEALEASLQSADMQERRLAGGALREMCWDRVEQSGPPIRVREPSDALLRQTFETLGLGYPWEVTPEYRFDPYCFLALYPERSLPLVEEGLGDDDALVRLRSAGLAVLIRAEPLYARAAPVLVESLRSNDRSHDARFAAYALYHMGPAAEASLAPAIYANDIQQQALVRLVLQNLGKPSKDGRRFPDEEKLRELTMYGARIELR